MGGSALAAVDHPVDDVDDDEGKGGGGKDAEDDRPGEAGEDRVEGDNPVAEEGGASCEEDRRRIAADKSVLHHRFTPPRHNSSNYFLDHRANIVYL